MINKQHLLTYIYLLLYTTLSSGVILYNKASYFSVCFLIDIMLFYLLVSIPSFTLPVLNLVLFCFLLKRIGGKENILIFLLYWKMVLLGILLFAVVPVHKVLQLSVSNHPYHDSHGIFWCSGVLSYPSCEGMTLLKLVLPFLCDDPIFSSLLPFGGFSILFFFFELLIQVGLGWCQIVLNI